MSIISEARKFRKQFLKLRGMATDEMSVQVPELYPVWQDSATYTAGERVFYNDILYKVLLDHVAQPSWTPSEAPSLFAKLLVIDENTVSEWEQPDSTNPYMLGDKVTYNNTTWVSTIDNNIWAPGVYGWEVAV